MSRVLITGGAGMIGAAVARRLLTDPAYDVRIADVRPAPQWMREGCEVRDADLRVPAQAQASVSGCTHVIHIASSPPPDAAASQVQAGNANASANARPFAHTQLEYESALHNAVIRAALDRDVQRFVYVSSPLVFERAELSPTPEDSLAQCPAPLSPAGFGRLIGERCCRAAYDEHGFAFTICRPFATYGADPTSAPANEPGVSATLCELIAGALAGERPLELAESEDQTLTPTHVDDVAGAIVTALAAPAALGEDFNIAAARVLSVAEIARVLWQACGEDPAELALEQTADSNRVPLHSLPAVDKARELLGWQAQIAFEDGIASLVASARERASAEGRIGSAL